MFVSQSPVNVSILTEMCVLCMFLSQSPVNCECFNIDRDACAVYVCVPISQSPVSV